MAIQIIREVSADVVKRGTTRAVYAKQNDINSRFLNVRIQEDGKDIVVKPTSTVMLNVARPDNTSNIFYGTVNEDGTIQVPMTSWMLELEGTLSCDVSIVAEDPTEAKLTTMQFNIYVEAAVVSDGSFVETTEYSVIVDLLNRTDAAAGVAERAAADAEKLRRECEDAAKDAQEAAAYANRFNEALNVERNRIDEIISHGTTGEPTTQELIASMDVYPSTGGEMKVYVTTNGSVASIKLELTDATIENVSPFIGYQFYLENHPELIPLCDTEIPINLSKSNAYLPDVTFTIQKFGAFAKIQMEYTGEESHFVTLITAEGTYPLASACIPEVADIRVDSEGNIYPTAGEAVRSQMGLTSQGRSAKYGFTTPGWKRVLNIIRGTNGAVDIGIASGKDYRMVQCLAFDFTGFVKYPADTTTTSKPVIIKRYENIFGENTAVNEHPFRVTKVRIGYPAPDAEFPPREPGETDYKENPVNCYMDIYVDFNPENYKAGGIAFNMNYAGFADSHNCEAITVETDAVDTGYYGEKLTYYEVDVDSMPEYLNSDMMLPYLSKDVINDVYGVQMNADGFLAVYPATQSQIKSAASNYRVITPKNIKYAVGYHTQALQEDIAALKEAVAYLQKCLEASTFIFKIDGDAYTAKVGMTWGEWVASEHNTNYYTCPVCEGEYPRYDTDESGNYIGWMDDCDNCDADRRYAVVPISVFPTEEDRENCENGVTVKPGDVIDPTLIYGCDG